MKKLILLIFMLPLMAIGQEVIGDSAIIYGGGSFDGSVSLDTVKFTAGGEVYYYATSGDTTFINSDTLINSAGYWTKSGDYVYNITDTIGIGSYISLSKILNVKGGTYTDELEVTATAEINRLEVYGDNVVNRISYPLSGLSAFQQNLNIVVDGANVYMETDAVSSTGVTNLPYVFDEEKHILDCTTGAGTAGKAQVALTPGTATNPQINYVYVIPDGAGVATLAASTSLPTGTFAWHSIVTLQDVATITANGPLAIQRTTEAVKHSGRGQLSYMREKLRWLGAEYVSGCNSTLSGTTTLELAVSSGVVFQLHRQTFPALAVVADGISIANTDGTGSFDKFEVINDLNDINELADGSTILNGRYFSVTVWATMASSDQDGNQSKLFINLPIDDYRKENEAITDVKNFDVRTVDSEFGNIAFLVCRIVLERDGGENVAAGDGVYSLTGLPLGSIGGGAGSTALTTFNDGELEIYNDSDPTKIIEFEAGSITTGNTRTITMSDADIDLNDVAIVTESTEFEGDLKAVTQTNTVLSGSKTASFTHDAESGDIGAYALSTSGAVVISVHNLADGMQGTIFLNITTLPSSITVNTYSDAGSTGLTEVVLGVTPTTTASKSTSITYTCANDGSNTKVYIVQGQEY